MNYKISLLLSLCLMWPISAQAETSTDTFWQDATIYFMLTDRFNNADKSNDNSYQRTAKSAPLRGFEGGDIKGITAKIKQGYFTELGVDAIWMTPLIEQIHGYDSSAGLTYSYHGYWPKDWTATDANYGSEVDLAEMIQVAHQHGLKVLLDVVINHTGPATKSDWAWPDSWIRTRPLCNWTSYKENVECALATSLTDIKTEIDTDVELPAKLIEKWRSEGRLEQELAELEQFFTRTGYPRAPKYYIVKWLTDWVREYGVDGFRVDTVKHVEADIWQVLKRESQLALEHWRKQNPELVKSNLPFYMVGEVYNWGLNGFSNTVPNSRLFDYGDSKVDFFNFGFDALINMGFVSYASQHPEQIFSDYASRLQQGELKGKGIVSYISSHDDEHSFDRNREQAYDAAFKLMLAPGGVQIYYGDELSRPLYSEQEALGDAHLRTFMNWPDLNKKETREILQHWQKLGQFRQQNPAVGLGRHSQLNAKPYLFKREFEDNVVLVGRGLTLGKKSLSVYGMFDEGTRLYDHYSKQYAIVKRGMVEIDSRFSYVLLAEKK